MNQQLEFREIVPFFLDAITTLGCNTKDVIKGDLDIACKCPVCGDSRTRKNLKRLHLYQKQDVINVNCFNGDCPVKNLTPYSFFKDYTPRIFEHFKLYYRKKYFNEIQLNKLKSTAELESWESNNDLFSVTETPEDENLKVFVTESIQNFQFTGDDDKDLENLKLLISEIKSKNAYACFKELTGL